MSNRHRVLPHLIFAIVLTIGAIGPAQAKPNSPKPEPDPEPVCAEVSSLPGPGVRFECAWTPAGDTGAADGTVVIDADGAIAFLAVAIRDSAPGDICYLQNWDKLPQTHIEASFELVRDDDTSYWDPEYSDGNWCGARDDLNGRPLTVTVSARVKKGTTVQISLAPRPAS